MISQVYLPPAFDKVVDNQNSLFNLGFLLQAPTGCVYTYDKAAHVGVFFWTRNRPGNWRQLLPPACLSAFLTNNKWWVAPASVFFIFFWPEGLNTWGGKAVGQWTIFRVVVTPYWKYIPSHRHCHMLKASKVVYKSWPKVYTIFIDRKKT